MSGSAGSLVAVEQWENLLDDLDCIELAARYTWLTSIAGKMARTGGEALSFYAHCPFCSSNDSLYLREGSYHCCDCQSHGSAIDFFMNVEKCSCSTAIAGLQSLLNAGDLQGRRLEQQQRWEIMAEARRFYQEVLWHRAEGARAKRWLSEQGIGTGTVERFGLGYAPLESDELLQNHLLGQGYSLGAMEASGVIFRNAKDRMKDSCKGMIIPIGDHEGNLCGFCTNRNMVDADPSVADHWVQSTSSFSERRLRRLIVPAPMWPQDLNKFEEVVITRTAWEVVLLHSVGIENAVYIVEDWHRPNPHAMRTVCALAKTLIYPCRAEGDTSREIEAIMEQVGSDYPRAKLLVLPEGRWLLELLQRQGLEAVRTAMGSAVPLSKMLAS
ncbi:MAG: CHC2 zinc finger domain-containing protein [Nitrospirae bacterium]|nr:CHC2 zinc finger domain-containing protein [Nitrospirota bacterium]